MAETAGKPLSNSLLVRQLKCRCVPCRQKSSSLPLSFLCLLLPFILLAVQLGASQSSIRVSLWQPLHKHKAKALPALRTLQSKSKSKDSRWMQQSRDELAQVKSFGHHPALVTAHVFHHSTTYPPSVSVQHEQILCPSKDPQPESGSGS